MLYGIPLWLGSHCDLCSDFLLRCWFAILPLLLLRGDLLRDLLFDFGGIDAVALGRLQQWIVLALAAALVGGIQQADLQQRPAESGFVIAGEAFGQQRFERGVALVGLDLVPLGQRLRLGIRQMRNSILRYLRQVALFERRCHLGQNSGQDAVPDGDGQFLPLDALALFGPFALGFLRRGTIGMMHPAIGIGADFDDLPPPAAVHHDGLGHLLAGLLRRGKLDGIAVGLAALDLQLHITIAPQRCALAALRWWEKGLNGKPVRRKTQLGTVEDYPNESQAQSAADAQRLTINLQAQQRPHRQTTITTLWEHYSREELTLKELSTQDNYTLWVENWILPKWGDLLLERVKTVQVEKWLREVDIANATRPRSAT